MTSHRITRPTHTFWTRCSLVLILHWSDMLVWLIFGCFDKNMASNSNSMWSWYWIVSKSAGCAWLRSVYSHRVKFVRLPFSPPSILPYSVHQLQYFQTQSSSPDESAMISEWNQNCGLLPRIRFILKLTVFRNAPCFDASSSRQLTSPPVPSDRLYSISFTATQRMAIRDRCSASTCEMVCRKWQQNAVKSCLIRWGRVHNSKVLNWIVSGQFDWPKHFPKLSYHCQQWIVCIDNCCTILAQGAAYDRSRRDQHSSSRPTVMNMAMR